MSHKHAVRAWVYAIVEKSMFLKMSLAKLAYNLQISFYPSSFRFWAYNLCEDPQPELVIMMR